MVINDRSLIYTNFGVDHLKPVIEVFNTAESKYGISFISSRQLYEFGHMRIWSKLFSKLTNYNFGDCQYRKNLTNFSNKTVFKIIGKGFSFKILFNIIKLKKTKHACITLNDRPITLRISNTNLKTIFLEFQRTVTKPLCGAQVSSWFPEGTLKYAKYTFLITSAMFILCKGNVNFQQI